MNERCFQRCVALGLCFTWLGSQLGNATTIDMRPRPTVLLSKSEQFIAQDAWNSVALYGYDNAQPIRRFPAGSSINKFEATANEKLLLVACDNGEIGVWNIRSGNKLWWHTSSQSGLTHIYGTGFSWDGQFLVACNERDLAVVFNTLTGQRIGMVQFPPWETNIMSASLSSDGSKGAFVDLGGSLFTFETATGEMKDTGLKGAWPVRYSADSKHVALRSNNSGPDEQLRVVAVSDLSIVDVGQFRHIGHIKATEDGGFVACAYPARKPDNNVALVGVKYSPDSGELKEVWRLSAANPEIQAENRTDFDPEHMIGVSTNYRLVTSLIDLRTGKPRLKIDNSANYQKTIVSTTSTDLHSRGEDGSVREQDATSGSNTSADLHWTNWFGPWFVLVGAIVALVVLGWLVASFVKSNKINPRPD